MQVNLTGHHIDISSMMQDYLNEKIQRLERHFDQALDIHVVLSQEKLQHKAEATMHVSGATLHADAVCEDMYAAIDALADKLDRQGLKFKEKSKSHKVRGAVPQPA